MMQSKGGRKSSGKECPRRVTKSNKENLVNIKFFLTSVNNSSNEYLCSETFGMLQDKIRTKIFDFSFSLSSELAQFFAA